MATPTSVMWFRRDLRLHDNPALLEALSVGEVLPLFVLDPVLWGRSGPVRRSYLAASLCEVDEAGFAITDADGRTSRPGVWAVGNAADPLAHLVHAAAAGARVGPWVTNYLLDLSRTPKSK